MFKFFKEFRQNVQRPLALVDGFYPDYHPEQKAAILKSGKLKQVYFFV